jgi:hypothetical protein
MLWAAASTSATGDAVSRVGFANSGGLVFMDESAEEIPTLQAIGRVQWRRVGPLGGMRSSARCGLCSFSAPRASR